ncbi:MAG: T9SS type A sorting domain-containing protein [Bacteroidales bacterium]|nr:T9SS type A sorting domain-containing protein [Bacteroidales bacterium]
MKKSLLLSAVLLAGAWGSAQALERADYLGTYVCTNATGVEGAIDGIDTDAWIGSSISVEEDAGWFATESSVMVKNMLPVTSGTLIFYGAIDAETGVLTFNSMMNSYSGYDLADAADPSNYLTATYSSDRKTITVENMAMVDYDGNVMLKAEKLVWELPVVKTPNPPLMYLNLDPAQGGIVIDVTAPITYDDDADSDKIEGLIDRMEIQRSSDGGETYETIKYWNNVEPGAELSFVDEDVDFNGNYVYYKAVVTKGSASSSLAKGTYASKDAPDIDNLSVISNKGAAPVTVSFTLPSNVASPLTSVYINRRSYSGGGQETIKTYTEDLTEGLEIEYIDEEVESGVKYSYSVYTTWKFGTSWGKSVTILVDEDVPYMASNFVGTGVGNNVTLSWDAPTRGKNFGYFDPEKVRYQLTRIATDAAQGETEVIITPEGGIAETTFTDVVDVEALTQFTYALYTFTEGDSDNALKSGTCNAAAGPALKLPFEENFDVYTDAWTRSAQHLWTASRRPENTGWYNLAVQYWQYMGEEYTYIVAQADENPDSKDKLDHPYGFVTVNFYDTDELNEYYNYSSPELNFSEATYPVAIFLNLVTRIDSKCCVKLQAGNSTDDIVDFADYCEASASDPEIESYEWRQVVAPLADLAGKDNVRINFFATNGDSACEFQTPVGIDNILIDNFPAVNNLEASVDNDTVTLTWSNSSTETQTVANYDLYRDGELLQATIADTQATDQVELGSEHTYYVVARYQTADIEAPASNAVSILTSGIAMFGNDNAKMNVTGNVITINGTASVEIFTVDGRKVYSQRNGIASYNAAPGVYVVVINGTTANKVIIK